MQTYHTNMYDSILFHHVSVISIMSHLTPVMSLYADPTFTLRNVLNALKDVMDWKSLGDQLNINAPKINEIEVNNQRQVADCRRDLVQFWLESDVSCSWKKLIDTLKAIDQSVLAEEIRTTYCPTYQGKLAS